MSQSKDQPAKDQPEKAITTAENPSGVCAADVRAFLCAHPDFIANDPDLLSTLVPPEQFTGRKVVDMQGFMISRLQKEVRTLRDIQSELIDAASVNSLARERVHRAALALLDAKSFEHLIDYIIRPEGLARTVDVCTTAMVVESDTALPGAGTGIGAAQVRVVEPGGIDRLMASDEPCRLSPNIKGNRALYGPIALEVHSEAFVRLDMDEPPCLVAFGSRDPLQFHPDQAHDLLNFLGKIMERCLRQWLNLPPIQ